MRKSKGDIYIEQRPQKDYAVRKEHSKRASVIAQTQAKAVHKAEKMFPNKKIIVERVRYTNKGHPDKWRKK